MNFLCAKGWSDSQQQHIFMPGGMKSFFLHFSCLQQSFIDRGNGIDGQFIIFHGFFDVLLEAGMTENTVAQNTN